MKLIATLLLILFPSVTYADATVSQTPPHGSTGSQRDTHSRSEHRHRATGEGQSSRAEHGGGDPSEGTTEPDASEPDGGQNSPHAGSGSTKPDNGPGI
jgi:hypothetical protein